jgi:hypothetical protein
VFFFSKSIADILAFKKGLGGDAGNIVQGRYWYLKTEDNIVVPSAYPYIIFCRSKHVCEHVLSLLSREDDASNILDIKMNTIGSYPVIELEPKRERANSIVIYPRLVPSPKLIIDSPKPVIDHGVYGVVIGDESITSNVSTNVDLGKKFRDLFPRDKKAIIQYRARLLGNKLTKRK